MTITKASSLKKTASVFLLFLLFFIQSACTKPAHNPDAQSPESEVVSGVSLSTVTISPKEQRLRSLLSSPSAVFTDANGEASLLAKNILNNTEEFLQDLEGVLVNDIHDVLILADKNHYLSETFVPNDIIPLKANDLYRLNRNDLSLRMPAEAALREMSQTAKNEGISILVSSTYRSYEYQKNLYERNVKQLGKEAADRESARPGTSQHQLGTAIDFGSITDDFALTKAGKWLELNAGNYGFSLSYPQGYEMVTGYRWECWHYRFIGKEAVLLQKKWFNNVQQYMLEFIHYWRNSEK